MNYVMFGEMSFLNIRKLVLRIFMIKFSAICYAITDKFMLVIFVTCIFVTLAMCFY